MYFRIGKLEIGTNPTEAATDAALNKVYSTSLQALYERAAEMTAAEIGQLQALINDKRALAAKAEEILAQVIARETEKRNKAVGEANAVITATSEQVNNAQRTLDMMRRELDIKAGK